MKFIDSYVNRLTIHFQSNGMFNRIDIWINGQMRVSLTLSGFRTINITNNNYIVLLKLLSQTSLKSECVYKKMSSLST